MSLSKEKFIFLVHVLYTVIYLAPITSLRQNGCNNDILRMFYFYPPYISGSIVFSRISASVGLNLKYYTTVFSETAA